MKIDIYKRNLSNLRGLSEDLNSFIDDIQCRLMDDIKIGELDFNKNGANISIQLNCAFEIKVKRHKFSQFNFKKIADIITDCFGDSRISCSDFSFRINKDGDLKISFEGYDSYHYTTHDMEMCITEENGKYTPDIWDVPERIDGDCSIDDVIERLQEYLDTNFRLEKLERIL